MLSLLKALIFFPLHYKLFNPCNDKCIVRPMCSQPCIAKEKYLALRRDIKYPYTRFISFIKYRYGPSLYYSRIDMIFEVLINLLQDLLYISIMLIFSVSIIYGLLKILKSFY